MRHNPDNNPDKKLAYKAELKAMTDEKLADACEQMIWLSAYANNNPISCYHWQCDYCYDECQERGKPGIYSKAYERVSRSVS